MQARRGKYVEADFLLRSKGGALGCLNSVTVGSLATKKPEWGPPPGWEWCIPLQS